MFVISEYYKIANVSIASTYAMSELGKIHTFCNWTKDRPDKGWLPIRAKTYIEASPKTPIAQTIFWLIKDERNIPYLSWELEMKTREVEIPSLRVRNLNAAEAVISYAVDFELPVGLRLDRDVLGEDVIPRSYRKGFYHTDLGIFHKSELGGKEVKIKEWLNS